MTTRQPKTMEDIEEQLKIEEAKLREQSRIEDEMYRKMTVEEHIKNRIEYTRRHLSEELNNRNEAIEKYPWLKDFDNVKVEISDSPDNSMESRMRRYGSMPHMEDKIEDKYEIITAVRKIERTMHEK